MFVLFLATMMLLSALTSCANGDLPGEKGTGPSQTSVAETTEAEKNDLTDDLPDDLEYSGETIVFISCDLRQSPSQGNRQQDWKAQ